ncbi:MAG: NADH-quinone oxidoreductase subunit N, partial [Bacteroidetes bacterium]|nr:NADH-quinone oxidoreductase subunit N [Bacteroidota bacterium]
MNTIVILSVTGIAAMMSDVFKLKKALFGLSLLGLLIALVFSVYDWGQYASYFNQMVLTDNYAVVFTTMLIGMTFLWFLMSKDFFSSHSSASEHYALILFSLTGGVMMTNFSDLTILFLGLEILSISLYILAGSDKGNLFSNEASLKYFMIGSFATGFLLFGIALIYGATSSFNLQEISTYVQQHNGSLPAYFYAGILMILTGLTFKVSAVPFHFWAPDVYDGSPTLVTTYMLSVVKMAAFAALYRLFINCFAPVYEFWIPVFAIMS